MKNKLFVLWLAAFFVVLINSSVFAQLITSNPIPKDDSQNINPGELKREKNKFFQSEVSIESFLEPTATFLNFDDVNFPTDNSIYIAPNRYAGVSFYSPYSGDNTWLTHFISYSNPNALTVGYYSPSTGIIYSNDALIIDFDRPAKDVSFLWGQQSAYNVGQIQVYNESNQLAATVPVYFNGYTWASVSLNPYSQRIKRLVLTRPVGAYSQYGHILLDNFQFSPITTQSPTGHLDGVDPNDKTVGGWAVDPDNTSASINVECYVDGNFMGRSLAGNASPDVPYPGNHRFSLLIPMQYRDGVQHRMNCYGLDVAGGDPRAELPGSPKNFKFFPSIGNLDGVDSEGNVTGWSLDPDLGTQSNTVHFYIDGGAGAVPLAGQIVANLPSPDVTAATGHQGNHRFKFAIPAQYRDNRPHTIYAYGIDLTNDQNSHLGGSPKTFTLTPVVQSVTFESFVDTTHGSSVITNPQSHHGGQRIFPDKQSPTDNIDRKKVKVTAKLSSQTPNVPVFFRSFDLDDPSTDDPIIDPNGTDGYDNKGQVGRAKYGLLLIPVGASNCTVVSKGLYCTTDANGFATVDFLTTMQPGDNFAVAASATSQAYLDAVTVNGTDLKDSSGASIPFINLSMPNVHAARTEMLTVWRRVHIELDSMGASQGNYIDGQFREAATITESPIVIQIDKTLMANRFNGGRVIVGNSNLKVTNNYFNTLEVATYGGTVSINNGDSFRLYDDDDFNDDDGDYVIGDTGENIPSPHTDYLTENSDNSQTNILADAYIHPVYSMIRHLDVKDDNIFAANIPSDTVEDARSLFVDQDLTSTNTDNEFWTVYILGAYQGAQHKDGDPPPARGCVSDDITCVTLGRVDAVTNVNGEGSGALIYFETHRAKESLKGYANDLSDTAAHEVGHLFSSIHEDGGIMGGRYVGIPYFSANSLNKIRGLSHP